MVRLSANSIRVVSDSDTAGIDTMPAGNLREPDHVGAWLREARETTGRDLRDVAAHLRIRYPYLLAIEEGRFDDLPGRAYAAGFIRSYAAHLGLDGDAMVARFRADVEAVAGEQNLRFPTPAPEGRFPGTSVLLISMILAAALIGGWYYYQDRGAIGLERVPSPPTLPDAGQPAPVSPAISSPAAQALPPAGSSTAEARNTEAPTPGTPSVVVAGSPAETPVPGSAPGPVVASEPTAPDAPAPRDSGQSGAEPPRTETMAAGTPANPTAETVTTTATAPMAPEPAPSVAEPIATAPSAPVPNVLAPAVAEPVPPQYEQMAAAEPPEAPVATPAETPPERTEPQTALLPPVPGIAPASEPQGRDYGMSNRDARIILSARGDCWLQVSDASQNVVFTRVLAAGERYRVPNREGLLMRVGNPSILDVSIDGEPAFPLSDSDQPISDIALDPRRLRAGTAIR
jgi:cytoskeletal protein RodZ